MLDACFHAYFQIVSTPVSMLDSPVHKKQFTTLPGTLTFVHSICALSLTKLQESLQKFKNSFKHTDTPSSHPNRYLVLRNSSSFCDARRGANR
jgi:hypothetical protein